jgi:WD40 repeat protein
MLDPKQTHLLWQWKHGSPLIACCFDPKSRFLVSSSENYTLQRWDMPSGKKTAWEGHESWVRDLAFLPDGETLISAGSDDTVILWNNLTSDKPTPRATIKAHAGWVRSVSVSPDGTLIASGGNDKLVKLWKAADGSPVRTMEGHEGDVYSTFFHPDGKTLLSGDLMGKVHQWEMASGKLVRTLDAKDLHTYNGGQRVHYGGVRGMALSPDGKTLACCGLYKATNPLGAVNEPLVLLFDWESGKKSKSLSANGVRGIGWDNVWLSDGSVLCASGGGGGGFLLFWKPDAEQPYHKFKLPNTARDMSLSPDGLLVATAHHDGQLRVSKMTKKG